MKIEIENGLINESLKDLYSYSEMIQDNNEFLIDCYQKSLTGNFDKTLIEKIDYLCQEIEAWDNKHKTITKSKELTNNVPEEFVYLIELLNITIPKRLEILEKYHDKIVELNS